MAVHEVAEVHDPPSRELAVEPLGLGVGWMVQAVPFHRSASVTEAPSLVSEDPTAVQAETDVHDTACNVPVGACGLGVDSIDQPVAPVDGRSGTEAGSGTAEGRTGAGDAWAADVAASIAPALRATAIRAAAYLPSRRLDAMRAKLIVAYPQYPECTEGSLREPPPVH
jgi:hypothetical protein